MKVIILAGGLPSSIREETGKIPKPMVKIGERPALWHINITVDLQNNDIMIHNKISDLWKVTVVDTGLDSPTGERIRKIKNYIDDDAFLVCYSDCITDLNLTNFMSAYYKSPHLILMAVARPSGRNAVLNLDPEGNLASDIVFQNNCRADAWGNTCHMILSREIFLIWPHMKASRPLPGRRRGRSERVFPEFFGAGNGKPSNGTLPGYPVAEKDLRRGDFYEYIQ